jgi:hypothetical protein
MSWQSDVVDTMLDLKRDGQSFDGAWRAALELHPPRGRDMGPERPTLLDRDESVVAFFRAACSDAWHNRRPALQHFHASLLIDRDATGSAVQPQRHRKLTAA